MLIFRVMPVYLLGRPGQGTKLGSSKQISVHRSLRLPEPRLVWMDLSDVAGPRGSIEVLDDRHLGGIIIKASEYIRTLPTGFQIVVFLMLSQREDNTEESIGCKT